MHLFHIPQCTIQNRNVYISVLNGALWDMEQVHCGICEMGLLQSIFCYSMIAVFLAAYVSSNILSRQYTSDPKETGSLDSCPFCLHPSWGLPGDLLEL